MIIKLLNFVKKIANKIFEFLILTFFIVIKFQIKLQNV